MIVCNLYGGPGSGKSTTAAGLFYFLKKQGTNVELVTEYAKDLLYSGHLESLLDQQEYLFAEQNYRLHRLRDKVDIAITDSPLLLTTIYARDDYPCRETFCKLVLETYQTYNNINIFLNRPPNYQSNGRLQSLDQSKTIDQQIKMMLGQNKIPFHEFDCGDKELMNDLIQIL